MSTKPTTSRGNFKLPPIKETILTRRKSAQQKRQLRNKDSSIKRISQYAQLLLSPTKTNTSKSPPAKSKGNVSKNLENIKGTNVKNIKGKGPEKKDINRPPLIRNSLGQFASKVQSPPRKDDKSVEYYPNKLKRSFEGKKVVLKPKHELKVVVGTRIRKRKLVLPQKGADTGLRSPPPKRQKSTNHKSPKPKSHCIELSIQDLVQLHNDDTLDDEDWLEILTCPSPVWWEDPPDPAFDDEPVLQLPDIIMTDCQKPVRKIHKSDTKKIEHESLNITEVLSESNVKVLEMKKCDDKFMKKRSKLEKLLGNIKNKVNSCIELSYNSNENNVKRDSDIEIKKTEESSNIKSKNPVSDSNSKILVSKKQKRTSESTEEDLFSNFRDEDLLNDLENIEIPIKSEEDNQFEDKNIESLSKDSSNVDKDENFILQKETAEELPDCNSLQDKSGLNKGSNAMVTYKPSGRGENNTIAKFNSQISKLTTTSIEKDVNSSPSSAKSVISSSDEIYETCSVKCQEVDTISDTNIKFIDDDDASSTKSNEISEKKETIDNQANISSNFNNEKLDSVGENKDKEIKQPCAIENVNRTNSLQHPRKEKDCMTVYKIISNEKDNSKTNNKGNKNNSVMSKINELIKASKEYNTFKTNLQSSETNASKTKLDSFFKKHKHHQAIQIRRTESDNNNSITTSDNDKLNLKNNLNTDINERPEKENNNKSDTVIDNSRQSIKNQNSTEEKSIIVHNSSTAIKYCLKCSSIFDTNNCNYCVEKAKTSIENHNTSCKNSIMSTHSEKSKDDDSSLCDLCNNQNNS